MAAAGREGLKVLSRTGLAYREGDILETEGAAEISSDGLRTGTSGDTPAVPAVKLGTTIKEMNDGSGHCVLVPHVRLAAQSVPEPRYLPHSRSHKGVL